MGEDGGRGGWGGGRYYGYITAITDVY